MRDKFNIAIIAGQLVIGGAEQQLYYWLANLDRTRYFPIVITLHPNYNDYWEQPIEALGIPLRRIPQSSNRLWRLWQIIKILKPHRPAVIHGWHLFASVYAGLAGKLLRTRSIGGVRNTFQTFESHSLEAKLTLWTVDGLVANSISTARFLDSKVKPGRIRVFAVQNAIQDEFIPRQQIRSQLEKAYNLPADALWIGSMGRLDPRKHFDWLIKLVPALLEKNKPIHFILIGDGPEMPSLKALIESLGISDLVTLTGEVPQASKWLQALDIFAFTSVDEGMPNVIMEAAAAGLPIVTWQLPFYEELLENHKSALLVKPGDMQAFEEALLSLVNTPLQRQSLGQVARQQILTNFSLPNFIKNMTAVYESILSGSPQPHDTRQ